MPMTAPLVYEGESTREISFPLGGIGTGSIGLSGAGRLVDWEIQNRPAKGITNGLSHFAVRAEQNGKVLDARILNGPYLGNRTGEFPADTSRNFGFGARHPPREERLESYTTGPIPKWRQPSLRSP